VASLTGFLFRSSSAVERSAVNRLVVGSSPTCGASIFQMYTLYIIKSSSSGRLYIGQTARLQQRLEEHQQGISRYTRGRGPWELVYHEEYNTRADAMAREKFLKSGKGRELIKEMLNGRAGPP
jgi:putative endonuclease